MNLTYLCFLQKPVEIYFSHFCPTLLHRAFPIRKCCYYIFFFSWFCHNCFIISTRCAHKNFMIMFPQFRTCAVAMTCLFGIIDWYYIYENKMSNIFAQMTKVLLLHLVLKLFKTQEEPIQLWYGCVLEPRMGH